MTCTKNENEPLQHEALVFILALARHAGAQATEALSFIQTLFRTADTRAKNAAVALDAGGQVYYIYAVLDSLSSSYSMFKYFFDIFLANNDPDHMHDVMVSPAGIVAITAETLFLVGFSFLANVFDDEKAGIKMYIAVLWPYFRDVIKGLKNAYKGWRSAILAIEFIGGLALRFLVIPVGITLGIIAVANRLWLRSMVEARKVKMKANVDFLKELKNKGTLTREEREAYLTQRRIKYQLLSTRIKAYAAVVVGGFIDGMYLYIGVLSLAALGVGMFSILALISATFALACIVTRVYEEYEYQLRLEITQTKCELMMDFRELTTLYAELMSKQPATALPPDEMERLSKLLKSFDEKREQLRQQFLRSNWSAGLIGIKNGLYAYSALASILFLVGGVLLITGTAFPPALLITFVLSGLAFLIGFFAHSIRANQQYLQNQMSKEDSEYADIREKLSHLDGSATLLSNDSVYKGLTKGMAVEQAPDSFFQAWFEVLRSLFSGFSKGERFVDFAGNPLQDMDADGHYHDTEIMYIISAVSAVLFGIPLAIRALARGFGKPVLGQINLTDFLAPCTAGTAPAEENTEPPSKPSLVRRRLGFFDNKTSPPVEEVLPDPSQDCIVPGSN